MTLAISALSPDEQRFVRDKIVEFNAVRVPFTQDVPFVVLAYGINGPENSIAGGIIAVEYCWHCVSIEVLWVDERCRNVGYGTALLRRIEREARERGCALIHLDTFDFQAKDFYVKHGYEVFGVLKDCPPGHERYYLKKDLTAPAG